MLLVIEWRSAAAATGGLDEKSAPDGAGRNKTAYRARRKRACRQAGENGIPCE